MKIFSLENKSEDAAVFALGFFDGVHLGHRAVIEKAAAEAKARGALSAVFTFTDDKAFGKKALAGEIYSAKRRCELFEEMGIDLVVMPDFSDFSSLSPEQFVDILISRFNAQGFVCGNDFRFGKNAVGTVQLLKEISKERAVDVFVMDEVLCEGESVSSTKIREALKGGDIKTANRLLGRAYSISAEVVGGKHLGTKKLYPTINQPFSEGSALLKFGVYASRVSFNGKTMPSVTNIGVCPTVGGQSEPNFETYIIDADVDLYGKTVTVELYDFIREEKKFHDIKALKAQIEADIEAARK